MDSPSDCSLASLVATTQLIRLFILLQADKLRLTLLAGCFASHGGRVVRKLRNMGFFWGLDVEVFGPPTALEAPKSELTVFE